MKTPHEWVEILTAPDRDFAELDMEDSIKSIQDEAFKAGRDAALEVVSTKALQWDEGDGYSPTKMKAAHEIHNAICARIEKP